MTMALPRPAHVTRPSPSLMGDLAYSAIMTIPEDLATHSDYMEVCYLLLNGNLPNQAEKNDFETTITYHTMVHEQVTHFFRGFRRDAHPMAIMVGVVGGRYLLFTMIPPIFMIHTNGWLPRTHDCKNADNRCHGL